MQHVKHIISDLDGVSYPYGDAFDARALPTYAKAAVKFIDGMQFATAMQLIDDGRKHSHIAHKVFLDNYIVNEEEILHFFQNEMDVSYMQPDYALHQKMHQANTAHSMLTASNKFWALRVISQLDLQDFYTEENLFARERCNTLSKAKYSDPYIITLNHMGYRADESVMIEDTQKNLKFAKEIGLTTVLVRPKKGEAKESFTDYMFDEPEQFWDYFNAQRLAL